VSKTTGLSSDSVAECSRAIDGFIEAEKGTAPCAMMLLFGHLELLA
jgi:hypothetical protein